MQELKVKNTKASEGLTDKAYSIIKSNIFNNNIEQGSILSESAIAKELGMSRTPVREAIRILSMEDIVDIIPGVGAHVKMITAKEIRDLYEIRKTLEVMAAKTSMKAITSIDIADLREKFESLLERHKRNDTVDVREFTEIDGSLHKLLAEKCDNVYVKSFMQNIMDNIRRTQAISYKSLNNLEESTVQHLKLLDLIEEGDYETLAEAIRNHIDWSEKCYRIVD